MHHPGHNFTGPGTKLNKHLNPDLTPKAWSKPINRVDQAAYHHDICYVKNKDTKTRNEVCDRNMLEELDGIYNPTLRERIDREIVRPIIGTKKRFGMGLKKDNTELSKNIAWSTPLAEELHKPVIKNFPKQKVYVNGIDKIWAADLVDMQAFSRFNHGVKYLLTVIDVFSKYGWIKLVWSKFSCWRSIIRDMSTCYLQQLKGMLSLLKKIVVFVKRNLGNIRNWIGHLLEGQLKKTGFCLLWRRAVLLVMLTRRCCLLPK